MGDYICPLGDCIDVLRAYFDPTGDYIVPVRDFKDLPAKYRRSSGATRPLAISCVPVRWLLRTIVRSPQVAPELVEAAPEPNQAAPELHTDPMGDYTDPTGDHIDPMGDHNDPLGDLHCPTGDDIGRWWEWGALLFSPAALSLRSARPSYERL